MACLVLVACTRRQPVSEVLPSRVLPVVRIDTRKPVAIDREHWRAATIGGDLFAAQSDISIKGRGNTTWERSDKKPYRIKLDEPVDLLGAHASKHYVLLSEAALPYAMITTVIGFEISRRMHMHYTPQVKPVELVLNGDYRGIYLLTEQVRVEPGRIEVAPWPRNNSWNNRGGWLLEVDGWNTYQRVNINSRMGVNIPVEYHYPKTLDAWQRRYITDRLEMIDRAICTPDKSSTDWERLVDIDALAKFYIVNELMDNCEAFSGSCWMSLGAADTAKLKFGPVWDFGSAFSHLYTDNPVPECFIYDNVPSYCSPLWLKELARFPRFQQCVRKHYRQFKQSQGDRLDAFIDGFVHQVEGACASEARRWPDSPVADLREQAAFAKQYLKRKISFLDSQWL